MRRSPMSPEFKENDKIPFGQVIDRTREIMWTRHGYNVPKKVLKRIIRAYSRAILTEMGTGRRVDILEFGYIQTRTKKSSKFDKRDFHLQTKLMMYEAAKENLRLAILTFNSVRNGRMIPKYYAAW